MLDFVCFVNCDYCVIVIETKHLQYPTLPCSINLERLVIVHVATTFLSWQLKNRRQGMSWLSISSPPDCGLHGGDLEWHRYFYHLDASSTRFSRYAFHKTPSLKLEILGCHKRPWLRLLSICTATPCQVIDISIAQANCCYDFPAIWNSCTIDRISTQRLWDLALRGTFKYLASESEVLSEHDCQILSVLNSHAECCAICAIYPI